MTADLQHPSDIRPQQYSSFECLGVSTGDPNVSLLLVRQSALSYSEPWRISHDEADSSPRERRARRRWRQLSPAERENEGEVERFY